MNIAKKIKYSFGIQEEIKRILDLPCELKEVKIRELANELGAPLGSTYIMESGKHLTEEVVRRIHEAARAYRESYLWLIAFLSALASLASAIAAWCAVWAK